MSNLCHICFFSYDSLTYIIITDDFSLGFIFLFYFTLWKVESYNSRSDPTIWSMKPSHQSQQDPNPDYFDSCTLPQHADPR